MVGRQTTASPTHCYYDGGPFTVTLTVSNTLGTNTTSQVINVPYSTAPKFTLANSTTAIGAIHIGQNNSQKVSLYLNSAPKGLAGYNLTVNFWNNPPDNTGCQHHQCQQAGMDT